MKSRAGRQGNCRLVSTAALFVLVAASLSAARAEGAGNRTVLVDSASCTTTECDFEFRSERSVGKHKWWYTACLTQTAVGSACNIISLLAFATHPELRKTNAMLLVAALATADLIFLLNVGIWAAGVVLTGEHGVPHEIPDAVLLCQINAFITQFTLIVSVLTFTLVAYDRYNAICHPFRKSKDYETSWKPHLIIYSFTFVLVSMLQAAGRIALQPSGCYCNSDYYKPVNFFFTLAVIVSPMVACTVMYFRVYQVVRDIVHQQNSDAQDVKGPVAMCMKMLTLQAFFLFCWAPCVVMFLGQFSGALPDDNAMTDLVASVTATANSALAPLFSWALFPKLRRAVISTVTCGVVDLKKKKNLKKKKVNPTTNTSSAATAVGSSNLSTSSMRDTPSILSSKDTSAGRVDTSTSVHSSVHSVTVTSGSSSDGSTQLSTRISSPST